MEITLRKTIHNQLYLYSEFRDVRYVISIDFNTKKIRLETLNKFPYRIDLIMKNANNPNLIDTFDTFTQETEDKLLALLRNIIELLTIGQTNAKSA